MPFQLRPFEEALNEFKASNPKKKLKPFARVHYTGAPAWSFKNLDRWPDAPPVTSLLHLNRDPEDHSEQVFESVAALVDFAHFGNAIGTWNAGGQGRFVHQGKDWILAEIDLTQEQASDEDEEAPGDYVNYLLALWRLNDGWGAAVLGQHERELALKLIGLDAWPEKGWATEKVWYGE